jgi:dihydroorotase
MLKKYFLLLILLGMLNQVSMAQSYDIVIKGGHIIDPKNDIDAVMDIAVNNGRIALRAKNIDPKQGTQVVDAKGMYVTPGLIDIHTHDFYGTQPDHQYEDGNLGIAPDGFTFRNGVTTQRLKRKPLTFQKPGCWRF